MFFRSCLTFFRNLHCCFKSNIPIVSGEEAVGVGFLFLVVEIDGHHKAYCKEHHVGVPVLILGGLLQEFEFFPDGIPGALGLGDGCGVDRQKREDEGGG